MKYAYLLLLTHFALTTSFAQKVDTKNSVVRFEISNFGVNTVEGTFSGMSGTVQLPDNQNKGLIDVCVKTASIDTDNQKRDDHLRSADYFDAPKYPEICFRSTEIVKSAEGYIARGTLTMHGVSKTVEIPLSYSGQTLSGQFTINRLDFKIGEDTNTFMMGEEVEVRVVCFVG